MVKNILLAVQIVSAAVLTLQILVQTKGSGLSKAWGATSGTSFARRGLEKVIFKSTFVVAAVFILASIFQVL